MIRILPRHRLPSHHFRHRERAVSSLMAPVERFQAMQETGASLTGDKLTVTTPRQEAAAPGINPSHRRPHRLSSTPAYITRRAERATATSHPVLLTTCPSCMASAAT